MKKLLAIALFVLGVGFTFQAQASHAFGSYISYTYISSNTYQVDFYYLRFCGTADVVNFPLQYSNSCSSIVATATLSKVSETGSGIYTPGAGSSCDTTGSLGFQDYKINKYSATVTLPDTCSDWRFVVDPGFNSRSGANSSSGGRVEALLNNSLPGTNSSPQYYDIVSFPLVKYQGSSRAYAVTDPDGDSLVYSLAPLNIDFDSLYSYTQPFGPDGNPGFKIDSVTGIMKVNPVYADTAQSNNQNMYYVGIQVEEYRNINGTYHKIGHIQGDIPYWVVISNNNMFPDFPGYSLDTAWHGFSYKDVIDVAAGQVVIFRARGEDPDLSNSVQVWANDSLVLDGATHTIIGGSNPIYTFTWTPTSAHVRSYPYYVTFRARDNHLPLNAVHNKVIGFRVRSVLGISDKLTQNSSLIPNVLNKGQRFDLDASLQGASVQILSAQGRVVKQLNQYQNNWTADGLATGIYFYHITKPETGKTYTGKLLIMP